MSRRPRSDGAEVEQLALRVTEAGEPAEAEPSRTPGAGEPAPGVEELLVALERVLQRLADPGAPLERAVADYGEARRLLERSEALLAAAGERAARLGKEL